MNRAAAPAMPAILLAMATAACTAPEDPDRRLSVSTRLSDDTSRYAQVTEPRPLRFPADHGPHPRYKHEWWYLTGQLATPAGRRFGFQFTVFREAVSPEPVDNPSRWATSQLYLAHAAVTDVAGRRYLSDERYARGALGLAGASASPLRVWLEDWRLEGEPGPNGALRATVAADAPGFGFELEIRSTQPPVAHGDRGMSVKGAAGNASHYYSYVRLDARGTVRVGDETYEAGGEAWLDHEWSSSALKEYQSGWDWFSLQLSDDAELMAFRLRHKRDAGKDFYSGTYVAPSGDVVNLEDGRIHMEALDHWTSEATGVRYPVRWRVTVPDLDLSLTTDPWLNDQELAHSFRYWEGAVRVEGEHDGTPLSGLGYVELAGYGVNDDAKR